MVSENENYVSQFFTDFHQISTIYRWINFQTFHRSDFFKLSRKKLLRFEIRLFSGCLWFPFGILRKLWCPIGTQWLLFGNIWKIFNSRTGYMRIVRHIHQWQHHVAWLLAYHVVLPSRHTRDACIMQALRHDFRHNVMQQYFTKKIHFIALREDSQADLRKAFCETSLCIDKVLSPFCVCSWSMKQLLLCNWQPVLCVQPLLQFYTDFFLKTLQVNFTWSETTHMVCLVLGP